MSPVRAGLPHVATACTTLAAVLLSLGEGRHDLTELVAEAERQVTAALGRLEHVDRAPVAALWAACLLAAIDEIGNDAGTALVRRVCEAAAGQPLTIEGTGAKRNG